MLEKIQLFLKKLATRHTYIRVFTRIDDALKIAEYKEELNQALRMFHVCLYILFLSAPHNNPELVQGPGLH